MEIVDFLASVVILIFLIILIVLFWKNKHLRSLEDLYLHLKHKRIPLDLPDLQGEEIDNIKEKAQQMSLVQRLYLLRSLMGDSYVVFLRVNKKHVEIVAVRRAKSEEDQELAEYVG